MEAVTLDVGQLVLAFIAAMGIPSAVMGFVMWKLERRISKRETEMEEREKAQEELFLLIVQSSGAAIALGEATARAVQRIPDAHCNGDMHAALEYARQVKHEHKEFMTEQSVQALY